MKNIYLTFDMDWASDAILEYWLQLVNKYEIAATIHVTHDTKMLKKFRKNEKLECGIHPNFNFLFANEEKNKKTFEDRIRELKEIVPEAVTCRSHCLTNSTPLLKMLMQYEIKYESNLYIPPQKGIRLTEIKFLDKLLRIPFIFEDDLYLEETEKKMVDYYLGEEFDMPRVFNFHPIHLFLNSENIERYSNAKEYMHDIEKIQKYRNIEKKHAYGIEDFFNDLIIKAKEKNYNFRCIADWEREDEC